ncbi:MAG: flippase-like domain-containing protein [Clostridiales bacterium]|nr:flippase-like domain-containing protein [Clostridiales bacterium]
MEIIDSIGQIPLWLVFAMLGFQIATQLLVNLQWFWVAKAADSGLSFWNLFYINSQGAIVDSITPGVKIGGEAARVYHICKLGGFDAKRAASLVALQKLFSLSALFLLLLAISSRLPISAFWIALIFSALFAIFFLILKKLRPQISGIRKKPAIWGLVAMLSLLIWVFYPLKFYILASHFATDIGLIDAAAIAFSAYLVAMLPIFPGGLGGFEATMAGLLVAQSFALANAAVITIFFRFATFWFVLLLSLAFVGFYKLYLRRKNA